MATPWNWKNKDGASGGLLYASGNWGDVLKMMWLLAIIAWKKENVTDSVNYFDPFAGDVHYPVSEKTLRRIKRCDSARLAPLGNGALLVHAVESYLHRFAAYPENLMASLC